MATANDQEIDRLEEAALWLERLETGRADRPAFERWRSEPANAAAFVRISVTSNWIDMNSPALGSALSVKPVKTVSRRWWAAAAAAVVAGAGGIATTSLLSERATARTGIGERTSMSLPDGGRFDLNTDSVVKWRIDGNERSLWLERGEVSVNVASAVVPLKVHASGRTFVLAPGEYNLRLLDKGLDLAVVKGQGRTEGASDGRTAILSEGHVIRFGGGDSVSVRQIDANAVEAISAWRNDELVLNGTTLSGAIREYNRYLKQKIVIDDPSIEGIQLGGRFTTKDPAEFVSALKSSFNISAQRDSDGTIHLRQ